MAAMRRKTPHTKRDVVSLEAASLFHSTSSYCLLPFHTNFDEIALLCAFAFGRVRFFYFCKRRSWLRTHSGRPPPRQSEFFKFQIDRRKQPWLITKPEPKRSGSNGRKQRKRNSGSWVWTRKPSSACIHTTGLSLIRNANTYSDRWNGRPKWTGYRHWIWN